MTQCMLKSGHICQGPAHIKIFEIGKTQKNTWNAPDAKAHLPKEPVLKTQKHQFCLFVWSYWFFYWFIIIIIIIVI